MTSVYVPNGRAVDHEHYQYKLEWLGRLRAHLDATCDPGAHVLVGGDFNICPDDRDVWDPDNDMPRTHVTQAERDALGHIYDFGLSDLFRDAYDDGGVFSWWDYRDGAFHKKMGLRIDLLLVTEAVAKAATASDIDKEPRRLERPSDHAPAVAEFDM